MDLSIFGWFEIAPEHVQVLNPALMLLLLVVANKVRFDASSPSTKCHAYLTQLLSPNIGCLSIL
jgi:hypothetical protein